MAVFPASARTAPITSDPASIRSPREWAGWWPSPAPPGGRIWHRCARAVGGQECVTDHDYAPAPARSKNRDALNAKIDKLTEKKSTESWVRELNAAGVPCGPIYSIDQMFEDAQVRHLGIAQDVPNAEDRHIRLVGQPVTLSRTPSKMASR